ncbi:hypothetical protein RIF29_16479 [Crotalaria pallida]|uniref:RBR-type E3 ubiquitin transferase n=1 Tax=Crotalaria pallida TaxID=3830 RepID=A0AAN9IC29_CROPI
MNGSILMLSKVSSDNFLADICSYSLSLKQDFKFSGFMGNSLLHPKHREVNEGVVSQNQVMSPTTCEICIEPLPADKVFNNNNLCVHPFCLDCIAKYIEAKVEENVGNIPCPALNCKQLLDPLFCRSIISKQLFDKWCDTLCASIILNLGHRSYCPNPSCVALVINECKGQAKRVQCPNCKNYFCFECQIPWHAGYRCEESGQLKDRNDVLFGELVERQKWCRCYKCGQCVERIEGCRWVQCRCRAICCYNCGEKYHLGPCHGVVGHITGIFAPLMEVNEAAAARNQVTLPATCEICIEPLTPDNVFNNNNQCAHPFCLDCIPKYIEAKVDDNIGNVPCPSLNCKQLLDPLFCRKFISKQLFEKWCDTLCTSMILNHEHHRRSYCPNRCCSALVINECKGNAKKVKCPNCKSYFCFKCQIPWHAGYRYAINAVNVLSVPEAADRFNADAGPFLAMNVVRHFTRVLAV